MRKMNFLSGLFGLLGFCAVGLGLFLAMGNRDAKPVLLTAPEAARTQITRTMDALCQGDYDTAGENLHGNPDLGMTREAAEPVGALVWDAFVESFAYELSGDCYTTDGGLAQDVVIRGLDIDSVTENLGARSQALLEQRVENAENPAQLYDENNDFREDLVMEVLFEAARQALEQDAEEKTWEITVNLVYENGQWWILPENALLEAISGGILK